MKKDLINNSAIISYSFRSKQKEHLYRHGNFIYNFPIVNEYREATMVKGQKGATDN